MTYSVFAKPFLPSSEGSDLSVPQEFKLTRNLILRAVKVRLILLNDPTFTSISAKIYSNNENAAAPTPASLLFSSTNSKAKADLISSNSAISETYFLFSDVYLRKATSYHLILSIAGYTASDTSHIAWKHAHPDPFYGAVGNIGNINQAPLEMFVFGAAI